MIFGYEFGYHKCFCTLLTPVYNIFIVSYEFKVSLLKNRFFGINYEKFFLNKKSIVI